MNLEEAIQAGYANDSGLLKKLPAIEPDGRAIIPYGVRHLAKDCIRYDSKVKYLLLPDTLEIMAAEAIKDIQYVKGVATYKASDDPKSMAIADGVCDLRSVKRFVAFPMMGNSASRKPLFDEVVISADAEVKGAQSGCDGSIIVVGDGKANVSVDGVLYTDGGKTLMLFPPTQKPVKEFVVPETVKRIAPGAFKKATINTVVLSSGIEEVCQSAFAWSGVKKIIIPSGIGVFSHETTRKTNYFGNTNVIRDGVFSYCADLESVKLDDGVTVIAENMFYECRYHFSEINIPESLSTIEEGAFEGCAKLSLIIPETVKSVAPGAFCGTKSVILPNSCASVFEEHLSASWGTVVAVAGDDGAGIARAGYTPPGGNLTSATAAELSSGVAYEAIDARFHDGGIKKFEDKIRVAITRLLDSKRGHHIDAAMEDEYAAYIKKNAKKAAKAFDEEGDIVCSRLLEELGYESAGLAQKAKEDAAKPKKASVAQLTKAAIEAMRKGDASKLNDLKPIASKVNPIDAVRLLKYAAIKGDAEAIEQLYGIFGKFEMPSIALCYAIAFGNDSAARALLQRGVTLGTPMDPIPLKGDTFSKQANRQKRYINDVLFEDGLDIPGRMGIGRQVDASPNPGYIYQCALSSKSDDLVSAYAEEGLLCPKDLKGLMLACLAESSDSIYMCGKPKPKLARLLAKCGGMNGEYVTLHVQRGPQNHHADICDIEDLLYPGCSTVVAKAVCSIAPERISGMWDQRYLKQNSEVVRILVPYLDPTAFKNAGALLNVLAKNGFDDEVKRVCKWEGVITEKMLEKAIETASETGQTATTALLIDLKGRMFGDSSGTSLEL